MKEDEHLHILLLALYALQKLVLPQRKLVFAPKHDRCYQKDYINFIKGSGIKIDFSIK